MKKLSYITIFSLAIMVLAACNKVSTPTASNEVVVSAPTIPESVKAQLSATRNNQPHIELRKFPYPYRSMLAIASDADNTTVQEFEDYHRFLNTKETTRFGTGLGLDIADSMFMYMGNNLNLKADREGHGSDYVMTYFSGVDAKKENKASVIRYYYNSGWIDSFHGMGDFSRQNSKETLFKRELAVEAWKSLNEYGIHPKVWINHGNESNVASLGGYNLRSSLKYQAGDDPKSPYYHTDLTVKNGVKFVWNSIGEPEFGNDSPIYPIALRDGQKIWGFHRYTHDLKNGQINWMWTSFNFHRQLTKERLEGLVNNYQYSVLAQHLGGSNYEYPFLQNDVEALRLLAAYQDQGKILVARTQRLLDYSVAQQFVQCAVVKENGTTWINIYSIKDPNFGSYTPVLNDVRGLTFYVDNPQKTFLLLNGQLIDDSEIVRNKMDEKGKVSISIKWFLPDYTDYTKNAPH